MAKISRAQAKWASVVGTLTGAAGAVASSFSEGPPWLVILLWGCVAIGVVISIVLTLRDHDDSVGKTTSATHTGTGHQFQAGGDITVHGDVGSANQFINWQLVRERNALLREHSVAEIYGSAQWYQSFDMNPYAETLEMERDARNAELEADTEILGARIKIGLAWGDDRSGFVHGFRCELSAPTSGGGRRFYIADDREREIEQGLIKEWQVPDAKREGKFVFPDDFKDTKGNPAPSGISAGVYSARWFEFEYAEPREIFPHFLKDAAFRVSPDGQLDMGLGS